PTQRRVDRPGAVRRARRRPAADRAGPPVPARRGVRRQPHPGRGPALTAPDRPLKESLMKPLPRVALTAALTMLYLTPVVRGDEGMWLFNAPPTEYLQKKYDFKVTRKWLEHVQKSSVRFNSGGSGSFVSPDGLVLTNHHVGLDALQKLGDLRKKDFVTLGF